MILAPLVLALLQQVPPAPLLPVRPRDPFVFRCVLDKRARMLVASLDEDMWVAWDTANGGLVKAWKGGVNFDGAVYTTVHGPQPTSKGEEYTSGVDGSPWTAFVDGKPVETRTAYLGYALEAGRVTLEWQVKFGTNRVVTVRERPEFVRPRQLFRAEQLEDGALGDGAQPALRRDFEAIGLLDGEQLNLTLRTDGVVAKIANSLERERFEDVKDDKGHVTSTRVWSQLPLALHAPHNGIVLVFAPKEPQKPAAPK